jgi:hypothetical protein
MRLPILRTTPGETMLCRGTGAVCAPQGHPHLACGPLSDRILQPRMSSADSTSRNLISLTTSLTLSPLDSNDPGGIDGLRDAVHRRPGVTGGRKRLPRPGETGPDHLRWSEVVARDGIEPSTFRFSGLGIGVRWLLLPSVACGGTLIRPPVNTGERARMRPKMRPRPSSGSLAEPVQSDCGPPPQPGSGSIKGERDKTEVAT